MSDLYIDPELVPLLDALPLADFDDDVVRATREMTGPLFASYELSEQVDHTDHQVGPGNAVTVRVHRPRERSGPLPAVVWIHGGGFVLGSHLMDGPLLDSLTLELGIVVAAVDYRLAPEAPYPAALNDCHNALRWTVDNAEELGARPDCVGVGGQSAGGALAAGLTLRCVHGGGPAPAFQLLDVPMFDDQARSASIQAAGLPIWSAETNRYAWQAYLGSLYGTDQVPAEAAPARATDLTGLPPTLIITGGADGLRDEASHYAQRLLAAGVPTDFHLIAGATHGVTMFGGTRIAERWRHITVDWLEAQLHRPETTGG